MTAIPLWAWALAVVAGGFAAVTRGWLVERFAGRRLPLGVLVANIAACALAGVVVAVRDRIDAVWVFVLVGGLCGALSTVADLSRDTALLVRDGDVVGAVGNVALNVMLGLGASWAAYGLVS
ncbi:MAG: CrcB family protein [Intrasporangium sp.]|uniref:FluC/FEX family fluoride channel n=1 Tax=Intrasporangium sp. TaxID=1925024 RepID=UPI00264A0663|nr:CrcB family protein [Intrasporangium sp.]MDN5797730.1 CrcB family protein [Intrasporangium sp.]